MTEKEYKILTLENRLAKVNANPDFKKTAGVRRKLERQLRNLKEEI